MAKRGEPTPGTDAPPADVTEALARARKHGRRAAAETAAALRALLDAAAIVTTGEPGDRTAFGPLAVGLTQLQEWIDPESTRDGGAVLAALHDALDQEIGRWEERSRSDPDARAVLRAFLGVRELLWEVGVRRSEDAEDAEPPTAGEAGDAATEPKPEVRASRRGTRLRRVRVEG